MVIPTTLIPGVLTLCKTAMTIGIMRLLDKQMTREEVKAKIADSVACDQLARAGANIFEPTSDS